MYVMGDPDCIDPEIEPGSELQSRDLYPHTTTTGNTVTKHYRREFKRRDFRNVTTRWVCVCRECGCRVVCTCNGRMRAERSKRPSRFVFGGRSHAFLFAPLSRIETIEKRV